MAWCQSMEQFPGLTMDELGSVSVVAMFSKSFSVYTLDDCKAWGHMTGLLPLPDTDCIADIHLESDRHFSPWISKPGTSKCVSRYRYLASPTSHRLSSMTCRACQLSPSKGHVMTCISSSPTWPKSMVSMCPSGSGAFRPMKNTCWHWWVGCSPGPGCGGRWNVSIHSHPPPTSTFLDVCNYLLVGGFHYAK